MHTAQTIGIYTSQEKPDGGAFLPLLLTQEGGEGRGEEVRFAEIPMTLGCALRWSGPCNRGLNKRVQLLDTTPAPNNRVLSLRQRVLLGFLDA